MHIINCHQVVIVVLSETSCLFSFSISDCVKKIQLIDNIAESEKMISFSSKVCIFPKMGDG